MKRRTTRGDREGTGRGLDSGGGTKRKHTNGGNNKNKQQKSASSSPRQPQSMEVKLTDRIVRPLILHSLTYLDAESLRQVCLLSQEFHAMVHHHPGMKQRMYDVLLIRPADEEEQDDDARRFDRLFQQLYRRHSMLQLYRTIKFVRLYQFGSQFVPARYGHTTISTGGAFQLNGIVTLDMSSSTATERSLGRSSAERLGLRLSRLFPNLREMNLSNQILPETFLRIMSETCVDLEFITWNNLTDASTVHIDGTELRHANNLTEICMDNAEFQATSRNDFFSHQYSHQLSDMENTAHAGIFLFHQCSNKLERVSIRNATYVLQTRPKRTLPIPQQSLIKFIRNAPSTLQSFRSNLTPENMTMLRSERPEIELLN